MPSFAEIDLGTLRVRDQMAIDARFGVDPRRWFAAAVAWHAAGRTGNGVLGADHPALQRRQPPAARAAPRWRRSAADPGAGGRRGRQSLRRAHDRRGHAPTPRPFRRGRTTASYIGGSEIKFTQGAALDLLASGPVVDRVRWHGPMPKFVDQDCDVRGFARGSASFYDHRIVVADWVDVGVRRSVGPDFDVLARSWSPRPIASSRSRRWPSTAVSTAGSAPTACRRNPG